MIQKVTDVPFLLSSGVQRIESLQTHQNFEVYKAALAIIDKFFSEEVTLKSSDWDFLKTVRFHFYFKCYIVFHLSVILLYSVQWRPLSWIAGLVIIFLPTCNCKPCCPHFRLKNTVYYYINSWNPRDARFCAQNKRLPARALYSDI